jgi:hypothetical protein
MRVISLDKFWSREVTVVLHALFRVALYVCTAECGEIDKRSDVAKCIKSLYLSKAVFESHLHLNLYHKSSLRERIYSGFHFQRHVRLL